MESEYRAMESTARIRTELNGACVEWCQHLNVMAWARGCLWSQGPRLVGLGNRRPGLIPPLRNNGRADKGYQCPRLSRIRREPLGSQGAERDGRQGIQRRALAPGGRVLVSGRVEAKSRGVERRQGSEEGGGGRKSNK